MDATMKQKCIFASTALALLMIVSTDAALAADAGSVLFARGSVIAERETSVALAKGDAVLDSDTIATGDASRAQLILTDGAKIAIRPNSRLRIEEYYFSDDDNASEGEGVVSTRNDRSVATLLKGGFRTITGAIGKEDEEDYEVRTAVGVLGIRGTDYSAVFCNGDCNFVPGVNPNAPIEDGLYLGVTEGTIFFRNENADIEISAGGYAFIPLADRVPVPLDTPPPVLLDSNDLRIDEDGNVAGQATRPGSDANSKPTGFSSTLDTRRAPEINEAIPGGNSAAPTVDPTIPAQPINGTDADGNPIDLTPGGVTEPGNQVPRGSASDPTPPSTPPGAGNA